MDPFVRAHWKDAAIGYLILAGAVAPFAACGILSSSNDDPKPPPPSPYVAPTFSIAPYTGPVTVCVDGWISHSTGRGTCSHHGGER